MPVAALKLKVGRAAGGGKYTIVGEAAAGSESPNAINTYPANIPVLVGDIIGIYHTTGNCWTNNEMNPADTFAFNASDVAPGTTQPFGSDNSARIPVSALVTPEPTGQRAGPTGQRAAALKKCKKKHSKKTRRRCRKKANLLPV
jgi:hypothetical protein